MVLTLNEQLGHFATTEAPNNDCVQTIHCPLPENAFALVQHDAKPHSRIALLNNRSPNKLPTPAQTKTKLPPAQPEIPTPTLDNKPTANCDDSSKIAMVIKPLATAPLLFIDGKLAKGQIIFDTAPWNNSDWREIMGLKPLETGEADSDGEESEGEGEGDVVCTDNRDRFTVDQADRWLSMSRDGHNSLRDRRWFTREHRVNMGRFLDEVWKRSAKEGRKCVDHMAGIPGYESYKGAVLAMSNRRGGLMERIEIVMDQNFCTPKHSWRDELEDNEGLAEGKKLPVHSVRVPSLPDTALVSGPVAKVVFGAVAVKGNTKTAKGFYDPATRCYIQRSWERQRRRLNTQVKNGLEGQNKYKAALSAASARPTVHRLRSAARLLRDWKLLEGLTGGMNTEEFKGLEQGLAALWEKLGYSRNSDGEVVVSKKKKGPLMRLGTDEEMAQAYAHYLENQFPADVDAAAELLDTLAETMDLATGDIVDLAAEATGDIGVAHYASTTAKELFHLLGLASDQLPFAEPGTAGVDGKPDKPRFIPRWHQLVGIIVILERMFTATKGGSPLPTLLCDDVGLGKTVMTIGVVCMLIHIIELQKQNRPLPAFLLEQNKLYFAGDDKLDLKPNLIWMAQIALFTEHGALQPILYSSQLDRDTFFRPGGVWDKQVTQNLQRHRVLLVVEVSALAVEARECLSVPPIGAAGKRALFEGEPPEVILRDPSRTIFSKDFNFLVFDESHCFRNANHAYWGAIRLAAQAKVVTGLSATPIFTGAKDLCAQGRLLRHKPMIGRSGLELGLRMEKSQRARAKEWKTGSDDIMKRMSRMMLQEGTTSGGHFESTANTQNIIASDYLAEQDKRGYRNAYVSRDAVKMAKDYLEQVLVRRTGESRTPDNQTVMSILKFIESSAWIKQRQDEKEATREVLNGVIDGKHESGSLISVWRNFLLDERNTGFHVLLKNYRHNTGKDDATEDDIGKDDALEDDTGKGDTGKDDTGKDDTGKDVAVEDDSGRGDTQGVDTGTEKTVQVPPRKFWLKWTPENFEQEASSRILKVCDIVAHHDDIEAKPMFFNRDGTRDLDKEAASQCPPALRDRKILIFIVYDLHREIMKQASALKLKGRKCLEYDGKMSPAARAQAIKTFEEDPDIKVMLISNVGTTGLNLAVASVVIFMSGLWSSMETKQMIGRVWRHGQLEQVIVYHILCPGTVDELLCGYANSKGVLHSWFLERRALSDKLFAIDEDESDDEAILESGEETTKPRAKAKATAVRPRPQKQQSGDTQETQGAEGLKTRKASTSVQPVQGVPSKTSAPRKRKATQDVADIPPDNEKPAGLKDKGKGKANPGGRSKSKKLKISHIGESTEPNSSVLQPKPRYKSPQATATPNQTNPPPAQPTSILEQGSPQGAMAGSKIAPRSNGDSATAHGGLTTSVKVAPNHAGSKKAVSVTNPGQAAPSSASSSLSRPPLVIDEDEDVDVGGPDDPDISEFVHMEMTSERWDPPTDSSEGGVLDPHDGTGVDSAPRLKALISASATTFAVASGSSTQSASTTASRNVIASTIPFGKNRLSTGLLSTPRPSGIGATSSRRVVPPSNSSSERVASKAPIGGVKKPPGQFKITQKPRQAEQPSRTVIAKNRITASEIEDQRLQKGLVVPKSPSRGRRTCTSSDDRAGSPSYDDSDHHGSPPPPHVSRKSTK
ncbi:hypothetical protein BDV93DRAFT_513682 [Ceratobasidium sp. AG-I]|nr:hypothetical protein BDV93DRAFT_513682 [Ceratobasidium sp. AG-I]